MTRGNTKKKTISHFSVVLLPFLPRRLHKEGGDLASSIASQWVENKLRKIKCFFGAVLLIYGGGGWGGGGRYTALLPQHTRRGKNPKPTRNLLSVQKSKTVFPVSAIPTSSSRSWLSPRLSTAALPFCSGFPLFLLHKKYGRI